MGFLLGSLTLIVLDVLLQGNAVGAVGQAGNVSVGLFRRFLAPDVAGIPQRKAPGGTPAAVTGGSGLSKPTGNTTPAPAQILPAPGLINL